MPDQFSPNEGGAGLVPTGSVIPYAGQAAPQGWLLCDGAAVSRTAYAGLYSVIGNTYGAGDGVNTFNLPNLTARIPLGVGSGRVPGNSGGEESHTLNINEIPAHNHGAPTAPYTTAGGAETTGSGIPPHNGVPSGGSWVIGAGQAGGGGAHNNMQPFLVLNYIVRT